MSDKSVRDGVLAASRPSASQEPSEGVPASPRLPTLQQNALCKVFDRPDFTPQEVAQLGYRRLRRAEGIGRKGMLIIAEWLRDLGYELQIESSGPKAKDGAALSRDRKKLEKAIRILRTHGYAVVRVGKPEEAGKDTSVSEQ